MNTLQWFMNLDYNNRKEVISSVRAAINSVAEKHHKMKLEELLAKLEEDHRFAKISEFDHS